jgi:hypothetical protein
LFVFVCQLKGIDTRAMPQQRDAAMQGVRKTDVGNSGWPVDAVAALSGVRVN